MKRLAFLLILFCSCGTQKYYTDVYTVKLKNGKVDNVKISYWNKFEMDAYKMDWLLRSKNINPDSTETIELYSKTFLKFKKKDL